MRPPETDVSTPCAEGPVPFGPATADELERRFGDTIGRRRGPKEPTPPPGQSPITTSPRVEVRLYVSADSMSSSRALLALQHVTRIFPPTAINVRVLDVARDVDAASRDRVLFTPTLIVTDLAQRSTRVLGDLSNVETLVDLLRATGVEPV